MAAKKVVKEPKSEKSEASLSPFDILNSINEGSRGVDIFKDCITDISDEQLDRNEILKSYVPFVINKSLSYFNDSVLFANEMNRYHFLPAKIQYDFLRLGLRPRKRFSKWTKKIDNSEDIKMVMEYYDYSEEKARAAVKLLSQDALDKIKNKLDKGGIVKK